MPVDAPVVPDQGHVAVLPEDYEATLAALRDAGYELTRGQQRVERAADVRALPRRAPRRGHVAAPHPPWPGEEQ